MIQKSTSLDLGTPSLDIPIKNTNTLTLVKPTDSSIFEGTGGIRYPTSNPPAKSNIIEPDLGLLISDSPPSSTITTTSTPSTTTTSSSPTLGNFLGSISGGGGVVADDEVEKPKEKKPFPYWIIAVAVLGGYLIFRKK